MRTLLEHLRQRPAIIPLLVFLAMIIFSLLLFTAAEKGSQEGMIIFLGAVALANLIAVFPR